MNITTFNILLVDDEEDIIEFLSYNLIKEGYKVYKAYNGKDAIRITQEVKPDLILLDVMMPEIDGIETCRIIRDLPNQKDTIIAMLTARGEDYSQIAGFDAGADDYITKPIKIKVLISRIKALLKRTPIQQEDFNNINIIRKGKFIIDKDKYTISIDNIELNIPKKEFELFWLLISKPNRVFSRNEIFDIVWGDNVIVGDRTIDVHIRKIREKIGNEHIVTIKGIGYKFVE